MTKLTIIQQNDTHGSLDLHDELFWKNNQPELSKTGGLPRIAKYIKNLKSQKDNVLFLDGGDLFHGTLPLVASKGEAIIPALQKMELDGWVPGNWDFAYGKQQLSSLANALPFPAVACNVREQDSNQSFLKPYMIKEMNGVKLGVIGLTYPYVDETMPESFSKGLSFTKGVEETRHCVEELKGKVDLIVLLSHMGLPLDVELATLVEGIDIILSGHSHDRIEKPITVNGALVVQAGSSASFLGNLEINMEGGKMAEYQYELIAIDESFPVDEEMEEIIADILEPYRKERDNVVGRTESILHRMTLNEAPMDQLITDAYLHAFDDCDLAFSHGWRYGTPVQPGDITEYDLHTIIPTNPEMFTLEMSGEQLMNALEKNLEMVFSRDPFKQKGGYILRSSGLFMAFKPYNPEGNRIQKLLVGGEEIDLKKTYKVAGGGKQLFKGVEADKTYQGVHAVDVIKQFLNEKGPFKANQEPKILSI
ncbi:MULTISPECIES: bifunctional UDP-sugar hydrolase/5'-nucleotidase [unclassified Mesobacillus]|uniref:bifunctional metallophosphatase/5'-nucleotidase n=1 Tax=unclassified Mesobacillus TaxID=2675270 RepID=UPI002041C52B|nr:MULTISPECIES: bifunctional UDP-sugar hydrolase/5'-nucleotidase [unclassified Mesobacillus]MCM3125911.1 bifunctional metallophosphatase/5'-nucleotidase [Mesobacillus sp. MER 33]MCM3235102.1 bifunctional metallophosphatase/5'-nucleotidase [Mesobacillus sp. MER 48]